jgi:nucleoside-diphosphate-sugar epimerase|tara:strand:+ start:2279 stop:3169 length:891 start_codon:yes stop_codon:yes gene_type:complete
MRIAVTGGAGFIGHNLVWRLLDRGHEVYVIDNFSTGDLQMLLKDGNVPNGLTIYECDIVHSVFPVLEIDAMVHLAAPVSVPESLEDPEKYRSGILTGSKRCFEWAKESGAKHIVAASTAAVYGDTDDMPISEDAEPNPMSPYAEYKLRMEELLAEYNTVNLNCTALRFFNVFGEGQRATGGYVSAVPIFLKQYNSYQPITVTGDGQQTRDFIYVGDICNAIEAAIEQEWQLELPIYNVGSGKEYKIYDLAVCLGGEIKFIAERNEPKRSLSDISNIKSELGWAPEMDVTNWLRNQK